MVLVDVHLIRGSSPNAEREKAVQDRDGRLYARLGSRWWVLQKGDAGSHSLSRGISDDSTLAQRLSQFASNN